MEPDNLKKILMAMELKNMERFDDLHSALGNISQVRGRKGEDGYTPVKGVDYFDGEKGEKGEPGEPGKQGERGERGQQGEKGEPGKDGKDGKDGVDGQDGSEDTPEVIADKLNSLEQALDWSVLKNFDSLVNQDTLKGAIQTLENQTRYLIQRIANSSSGSGGGSGGGTWGSITGTLSDQTDLQAALDAKQGQYVVTTVTSTTSSPANTKDHVILLCDAATAGGNITVNLPTAVSNTAMFTIKKTDSGANTIIIDPSSTQTIDGNTTFTLFTQYDSITLISNGSNWFII